MSYQVGPDAYSGNGAVDWAEAQSSGSTTFAILKACEDTTPDSDYATYRAQCKALNIPSSPYLFLRFGASASAPEAQAEALYSACSPVDRTCYVPMIDLEFPGGSRSAFGITAQQALDAVRACAQRIFELFGAWPGIYTSQVIWIDPDGMDNLPASDLAQNCPLWVKWWPYPENSPAVYDAVTVDAIALPTLPTPWSAFQIHQYQGNAINYQGFSTPCDLNRLPVLAVGSTGPGVAWLQQRVGATPDGNFGPDTEAAVKAFQTANGLVSDGVVGAWSASAISWVVLPSS